MTLNVEIGGLPIGLSTDDVAFARVIRAQYANFLTPQSAPRIHLALETIHSPDAPRDPDADLEVRFTNGIWLLSRGDFQAQWNPATGEGRVRQNASRYSIDSVLRVIHSLELARTGGFLLHAASAVRNGKAFLFSGVSGAGKTTISRMAPAGVHLLTDEVSYLRPHLEQFNAWGTPFAGELAQPGENISAPVQTLYFLEQARENSEREVSTADAMRMLMRNILFFSDDSTLVQTVFETAHRFLSSVRVCRLRFLPDARIWSLIQ